VKIGAKQLAAFLGDDDDVNITTSEPRADAKVHPAKPNRGYWTSARQAPTNKESMKNTRETQLDAFFDDDDDGVNTTFTEQPSAEVKISRPTKCRGCHLETKITPKVKSVPNSCSSAKPNNKKGTIISELIEGWTILIGTLPKYELMKRQTVEYVDVAILDMFLNEEHLKHEDPTFANYTVAQNKSILSNLTLLCAEVNCHTGTMDTKLNQRYDLSRLYPDMNHSLVVQPRFIKHTIWHYLGYVDGDLVAAHPTFLYCLCKQNNYSCPVLESYIWHRETKLAAVVNYYHVSRDQAKSLFNIMLYGGSFKTWTEYLLEDKHDRVDIFTTHGIKKPLKFIRDIKNELQRINKMIIEHNPELLAKIKNNYTDSKYANYDERHKEWKDENKAMAFVLGIFETAIVCEAYKFARRKKVIADDAKKNELKYYEFDGFGFKPTETFDATSFIDELNVFIRKATGWNEITFIIKPYSSVVHHLVEKRRAITQPATAFSVEVGLGVRKQKQLVTNHNNDALMDTYFAQDFTDMEVVRETCEFLSEGSVARIPYDDEDDEEDVVDKAVTVFSPWNTKPTSNAIIPITPLPVSYAVQEDGSIISAQTKFLVLIARMGGGKTVAIRTIIENMRLNQNTPLRILHISPRKKFANYVCKVFGFANYQKLNPREMESANEVVVQLESLCKTPIDYDLVILDESESIFNEFSSTTMSGKYYEVYKQLLEIVQNAGKVIVADAFMLNRSLDLIRSFRKDEETIRVIINTTPPKQKRCLEMKNLVQYKESLFENHIFGGKKLFVCNSSKKNQMELKEELKTYVGDEVENIDKYVFYHGGCDKTTNATIEDPTTTWGQANCIACTPCVTAGQSFDLNPAKMTTETGKTPLDNKRCFDRMYGHFVPSACVRDMFQMSNRVRHLRDNMFVYFIDVKDYDNDLDPILEQQRHAGAYKSNLYIEHINAIVTKAGDKLSVEEAKQYIHLLGMFALSDQQDEGFTKLIQFNFFEQLLSNSRYETMFRKFLELNNYTLNTIDDPIPHVQADDMETDTLPVISDLKSDEEVYMDISNIDAERAAEIKFAIEKGEESGDEKEEFLKFIFKKRLSSDITHPEHAGCLSYQALATLFQSLKVPRELLHFKHARLEKKDDVSLVTSDMSHSDGVTALCNMTAQKVSVMKDLNTLLGMENVSNY
jgi:hypothetical protein